MSLCSDRCHHIINRSSGVFVSEACGALNTAIGGNSMNNSCRDIYKLLKAIRFLSVCTKTHVRHSFMQTAVKTVTVTKIGIARPQSSQEQTLTGLPLCAVWRGGHPDVEPKVHTLTAQHRTCDVRGTAMKLRPGTHYPHVT